MKMLQAIAESAGNTARAYNDEGQTIVIQQRYQEAGNTWFHLWHIKSGEVKESDVWKRGLVDLPSQYKVDPDENYWRAI